MKKMEYRFVDKSLWGDGPWQDEPDKLQYTDPVTKLPCLIVRGPDGALCGYVGVPEGHPFFGKHYDADEVRQKNGEYIDVHGGLTFSNLCSPNGEHGICHVVEDGENDRVWWLGFDCAHCWDLTPKVEKALLDTGFYEKYPRVKLNEKYRGVHFVKRENRKLAKQLKAMQ